MWSELAMGYGLFILEILTVLLVIAGIVAMIMAFKQKKSHQAGELVITDLSQEYEENTKRLAEFHLSEDALKQAEKARKKEEKQKAKAEKEKRKKGDNPENERKPHLFVLSFKGDISASETTALREEVSAIIAVAKPEDEVLLRLESPGGVVHGYGLAASQLARLKQHQIKLTVAVDKVAASGGYMMACVADKIIAAPFAIIGSVGVVAQVPNIHRLLKKHDVDVDVMTAGEYKRTVTLLGENTEKGKEKFQQELNETHQLFKQFVAQHRPQIDVEQIATGEHWFGQQALGLNLVDEIATSDDLILQAIKDRLVLSVKYTMKKSLVQKLGKQAEESADNLLLSWLKRNERTLY
ncbi:protease SohB [Avibacterium gallinarum]|uniref:Protease SohB n=1 Tax=Avibacterium gallinarum TaxID=755 RepID=A0A379AVA7_AVIGA|nr:protease SohB [Avibacterium gallinarum]POY45398.1 protease SohB [Avibacterium gallinarum]TDP28586.1 serine protease SohB [Avibacterium gallinarum]SUB26276.1 protease SohB [Avibacterium gallinarum]